MKNCVLFVLLFIFAYGCQKPLVNDAGSSDYSKIAGVWQAENSAWQITITDEGKIESAVIPMGAALVKPNQTTYIEMKDDSVSAYEGGDFNLIYDPQKMEMEVSIEMKEIHIKFLDNEIKGKTSMLIGGPLLEDSTVWDAEVIERFDYGSRFPQDESDIYPEPLRFVKVKEYQKSK